MVAASQLVAQQDTQLDQQIKDIAAAHHGHVALYAHNLRTGQTASLLPDEPVQTASVIKMGILLDAAEQIRAGPSRILTNAWCSAKRTRWRVPESWAS